MINRVIIEEGKRGKTNLSMIWTDLQKAFNRLPYSRILESLDIKRIVPPLLKCISQAMSYWKTYMTLKIGSESIRDHPMAIKRGIFLDDSLSHLHFSLVLNPLTTLLNEATIAWERYEQNISNLLHMDDQNCFAKITMEQRFIIKIVQNFSNVIRMTMGLDKYVWVTLRRSKLVSAEITTLNIDAEIGELDHKHPYIYITN